MSASRVHVFQILAFSAVLAVGSGALAQSPVATLGALADAARRSDPAFAGFSVKRGAAFFSDRQGKDWSCTTCHSDDPRQSGRHAVTGKAIDPMAPAVNVSRLADAAKTEKWFRRNCKDVLGRECTVAEKGDVVAYLASLK